MSHEFVGKNLGIMTLAHAQFSIIVKTIACFCYSKKRVCAGGICQHGRRRCEGSTPPTEGGGTIAGVGGAGPLGGEAWRGAAHGSAF